MRDEALRLKAEGLTIVQISERLRVPRSTVGDWVRPRRACPQCGGEMGAHGHRFEHCGVCRLAKVQAGSRERAELIAVLWAAGATWGEIGAQFGWDKNRTSNEIGRIREYWPKLLPHRRTPEQRERMREARRRARESA
jgi:ribosomal protein S27AE